MKQTFKIDCLMPRYSRYSVLHHFITKLYEAFKNAGHSCRLLSGLDQFTCSAEDPPDFTIGFNGALRNEKQEFFCDQIKVPHVSLLVDPPYHYSYLIQSPYMIITCDDRYGCVILQAMSFHRCFFLPHAVERELEPDPHLEKVFDVVMLATFIDDKKCKLSWEKDYPTEICAIMAEAAEMALVTPVSFIHAFCDSFEKLSQKAPKGKYDWVRRGKILEQLELYVKGRDRIQLAESVTDASLHIFGSALDIQGWKSHFGNKQKNVRVHEGVTYDAAIKVMKQAKILLNPSIKNKDGAHERFFSGFACGALVLTSESRFLNEQFLENEEILYYSHQNPPRTNSIIMELLANESKRAGIVEKARAKVMQSHTWDNRAAEIILQLSKFMS